MVHWISSAVAAADTSSRRTAWTLALCAVPVVAFAVVDLPPRAHLSLSAVLLAVSVLIVALAPRLRLAVYVLSIAVSSRYMWYRATQTLVLEPNFDGALAIALFGAEAYAFVVLLLGYYQTSITRIRTPVPLPDDPAGLPTVDVFVPSYNEDMDLLRDTLVSALAMDYPHKRVYLLDDSRRPEARALTEELGCEYLDRSNNHGAKAGNVNAALKRTSGDLIAFFDADHAPVRSFLECTVGFFLADPKLALVQTPHYFYNADQFERNLFLEGIVPSEPKLFYHALQVGNDFWNAAFFCGSCAVIRREAMVGVGGMAEETLTEDAHTALKMHAAGWNSVYYDVPLAAGIATERLSFYISQRIRWARGMAQVLRSDNPLRKPGLTLAQRLNYFAASWHFLFGLPRLVFLLAPSVYLLFGLHPMFADVKTVMAMAIPHLLLSSVATAAMNRGYRHSFWSEVFETVMAPYAALVTTFALIVPRQGVFKVTTKGATNEHLWYDWRHASPTLVMLALTLASMVGMGVRLYSQPMDRFTIAVAGFWNVYNAVILAAAAATALERPQRRTRHRVNRAAQALLSTAQGESVATGLSLDLSAGGVRLKLNDTDTGPERVQLPEHVRVQLRDSNIVTAWLPARVLRARVGDAEREVRLQFDHLSSADRNSLVPMLFSNPESWTAESYAADVPQRALAAVTLAPLAALTGRSGLIRWVVGDADKRRIVERRVTDGARRAGQAPERRRAWMPALPSMRTGLLALLLVALAEYLAVYEQPAFVVFGHDVQLDSWFASSRPSRVEDLTRAQQTLSALTTERIAALDSGAQLRNDWAGDVRDAQRAYNIGEHQLQSSGGSAAETSLANAARFLLDAADSHSAHDPALIRKRLDATITALAEASDGLMLPQDP